MNSNIIVCAISTCAISCGASVYTPVVETCVVTQGAPKVYKIKMNCEAILAPEEEEKRQYATQVRRKNDYGRRSVSPTKSSIKKRNKKR